MASVLNGRYDPTRFPAALSYQAETLSSAQIFGTGKVVLVGCKTQNTALLAAHWLPCTLYALLGIRTYMYNFSIRNIVCSIDMGFRVNLDMLAKDIDSGRFGPETQSGKQGYDPVKFPGMAFQVTQDPRQPERKITIALFETGKGVATGLKQLDQKDWCAHFLSETLLAYREGHEYRPMQPNERKPRAPKRRTEPVVDEVDALLTHFDLVGEDTDDPIRRPTP